MHFLPAAKLAASATNFLARLSSGEKQTASAADPKKAVSLPGVKNSSGNISGFSDILRRAEAAGHNPDQNIRERAAAAVNNSPASLKNPAARQPLAGAHDAPGLADKASASDLIRQPGESTRNPDRTLGQDIRERMAVTAANNTPASLKHVPDAPGDAPASLKNFPAIAQRAPALVGAHDASGLADKAPVSDLIRQAGEPARNPGRTLGQDIRERVAVAATNNAPASLKNFPAIARRAPALVGAHGTADLAGTATKLSDIARSAGEEGARRSQNALLPPPAQQRGQGSGRSAAHDSAHDINTRLELFAGNEDLSTRQFTPLEKAPAAPHSINGVHYQLGEVGFTQKELAKLRDALLGEGLSPHSLTVIEQLTSHPHGATLGQLLALMQGNLLQQKNLPKEDSQRLQYFAGKIDAGGELGKKLSQLLEDGQHKDAWDAIKSSLSAVNPQAYSVFTADEAALLCKLFGISEQTSLTVLKQFGNADGLPLTSEFFTALMLPAQDEILNKVRHDDKLGQALAKHLQPIIAEARLRGEQERKAAEGADRKSKQTEVLIRDKAMGAIREDVIAPEKDASEHSPLIAKKDASGNQHETRKDEAGHAPIGGKAATQTQQGEARDLRAQDTQAPARPEAQPARTVLTYEETLVAQDKNAKAAVTAKTPDEALTPKTAAPVGQDVASKGETDAGHKQPQPSRSDQDRGDTRENNQDARRNARSELLARVEVSPSAHNADTHAASAFTLPAQPQEQSAGHISNPAQIIRHALQQVERGSLNKLAGGEQRLELQLAPSELGAITLILTSGKSGEISATIRSERSETAELVARHLDMIRVNLEEQGLKVDKLEVQNQMLNNRDDWQGMEQHNAMREEQERREHLERLRRLGRVDREDAPQARDVQLHEHTAEISGHGLHLVA